MSEHLTFNQINDQADKGSATVFVPRTDGSISIGKYNFDTKKAYFNDSELGFSHKTLSQETLSDKRQEELAVEFGGLALRALDGDTEQFSVADDSDTLASKLDAIRAKYDEGTQMLLWQYASGTINQVEYRLDGDTGSAEGERQKAGQAIVKLRRLGADVVADADNYLELMREQTRILRR